MFMFTMKVESFSKSFKIGAEMFVINLSPYPVFDSDSDTDSDGNGTDSFYSVLHNSNHDASFGDFIPTCQTQKFMTASQRPNTHNHTDNISESIRDGKFRTSVVVKYMSTKDGRQIHELEQLDPTILA